MNRKLLWLLAVLFLASSHLAEAQQPRKIPRIGYLSPGFRPGRQFEAFRQVLRDLGYIEGKNILIEYRYLKGNVDRTRSLVAELVQLKVDVLVSSVYLAIRVAKQATSTIPIVW